MFISNFKDYILINQSFKMRNSLIFILNKDKMKNT